MSSTPVYSQDPWADHTEIIDVRSEGEFAEDRIPGAINLPVLNNQERAEVGTIYKQSPFSARKIGAALVYKNLSRHLSEHFADKEKDYRPLVYCWRGGQRSNSMAWVLSQIGWRVTVLEGGYKTYRTHVREQLQQLPFNFTYQILRGKTGSGKTYILRQMQQRGAQVLDLEGLAIHRGSLLGEEWDNKPLAQPSQKYFESLLLHQLRGFNTNLPVWVESESNKIGKVYLPQALWMKMKQASCVEIQVDIAARVEFLLKQYPHLIEHPHVLRLKLESLKERYGRQKIFQWYQMIERQEWTILFEDLLLSHYDPTYLYSMQRDYPRLEQVLSLPELSDTYVNNLLNSLMSNDAAIAANVKN